jgi:hypothetical protein
MVRRYVTFGCTGWKLPIDSKTTTPVHVESSLVCTDFTQIGQFLVWSYAESDCPSMIIHTWSPTWIVLNLVSCRVSNFFCELDNDDLESIRALSQLQWPRTHLSRLASFSTIADGQVNVVRRCNYRDIEESQTQ